QRTDDRYHARNGRNARECADGAAYYRTLPRAFGGRIGRYLPRINLLHLSLGIAIAVGDVIGRDLELVMEAIDGGFRVSAVTEEPDGHVLHSKRTVTDIP